jgi:hypothetical protein
MEFQHDTLSRLSSEDQRMLGSAQTTPRKKYEEISLHCTLVPLWNSSKSFLTQIFVARLAEYIGWWWTGNSTAIWITLHSYERGDDRDTEAYSSAQKVWALKSTCKQPGNSLYGEIPWLFVGRRLAKYRWMGLRDSLGQINLTAINNYLNCAKQARFWIS